MKRCSICGKRKPLREFYPRGDQAGGRHAECRTCYKARVKAWSDRSRAWIRNHCRRWYQENHALLESATAHVDQPKLNTYYRLRHEAILAYGGYRCACCGEEEPLFLTLDHVNNDGSKQRRRFGSGSRFYLRLRRNGYPPGCQVLCYNCNCGRHRNGGVCPHKAWPAATNSKAP